MAARQIILVAAFAAFPALALAYGGGLDFYGYDHNRKAGAGTEANATSA